MKQISIFLTAIFLGFFGFSHIKAAPATGNVVVIKKVINDNGGTKASGDFTINLYIKDVTRPDNEPLALSETFPGADTPGVTKVLAPGPYKVDEVELPGYKATYSADCEGTVAAGQTKTCTITNNDIAPKLTVIKKVVGGNKPSGDFTIDVYIKDVTRPGDEPPVLGAAFPGADEDGTTVTIVAGPYEVHEPAYEGYDQTYSPECKGVAELGQEIICIVTNTLKTRGGGSGITTFASSGGNGANDCGAFCGPGPSPTPTPAKGLVAGVQTSNPSFNKNDPQILGASTTLPRTGFGEQGILALAITSFLLGVSISPKKKSI